MKELKIFVHLLVSGVTDNMQFTDGGFGRDAKAGMGHYTERLLLGLAVSPFLDSWDVRGRWPSQERLDFFSSSDLPAWMKRVFVTHIVDRGCCLPQDVLQVGLCQAR
jgi:hypothetical protein